MRLKETVHLHDGLGNSSVNGDGREDVVECIEVDVVELKDAADGELADVIAECLFKLISKKARARFTRRTNQEHTALMGNASLHDESHLKHYGEVGNLVLGYGASVVSSEWQCRLLRQCVGEGVQQIM